MLYIYLYIQCDNNVTHISPCCGYCLAAWALYPLPPAAILIVRLKTRRRRLCAVTYDKYSTICRSFVLITTHTQQNKEKRSEEKKPKG